MSQAEILGWAAGIATAVATVVTAALTFWFRLIDRPKPQWEISPMDQQWNLGRGGPIGLPVFDLIASNVGTGPARLVSIIGVDCLAVTKTRDPAGRVSHIALAEVGHTSLIELTVITTQWGTARLLITWSEPSYWLFGQKYRHQSFPISDYFPWPEPYRKGVNAYGEEKTEVVTTLGSEAQEEIRQQDKRLETSGNVVQSRSNRFARHLLFRKLRKAGWGWRRALPTVNPAQTDSLDDQETRS